MRQPNESAGSSAVASVVEPTRRAGVPGSVVRCGSHVSGRSVLGRVTARALSKAYPAGLLPHTAIL